MSSQQLEIVLMWTAVSFYAASSILFAIGLVFRSGKSTTAALWAAAAGLLPHASAIAARWVRVGHGPYLGFYEVVGSYAFVAIIAMMLVMWRRRGLALLGVGVMPISLVLIGAAMFTPKVGLPLTPKLASWWLVIHVTFAKLAYASFIASFGLALLYLLRERLMATSYADVFDRLPRQEVVDDLSFRMIALGFIFLGIMIAAGAVWANEAWGRYWAWDPIETWSLISWIVYAVYLHARLTLGWRGRRAAWLAVAAIPILLFAVIGVPIAYNSIHGAYLTGY